jgi:hypothetical protein
MTPGYPTLEQARDAGLFHPNCRHAYGLYLDIDAEIEQLRRELGETATDTSGTPQPEIVDYSERFINAPNGARITLEPAPEAQRKPPELVAGALKRAEAHASFTGVKVLNIASTEAGHPGANAFVIPGEKDDVIYLLASDVQGFAVETANQLKRLYDHFGLQDLAQEVGKAADVTEYVKKTLLHELGHIQNKRSAGNFLLSTPVALREYVRQILAVTGNTDGYIEAYEVGEWVAEDFRMIKDPGSIYPHAHGYYEDLSDPTAALKRREALKEAFGW